MNVPLQFLFYSLCLTSAFGLDIVYKWKHLDYDWQNETQQKYYAENKLYDPKSVVPIDVHFGKETFLAIPRGPGVPASLVILNKNKHAGGGPVLQPYPDWSWADSKCCNKNIVSVYRVASDKCGRLWVLDNGKDGETQKCPPKILAFDQATGKLLQIKEIPSKYAFNKKGTGLLVTPYVRTFGKKCENLMMYIADIEGYGLIIWDGKDNFRRYDSKVFAAQKANFTLNGDNFYLADGLVGLAVAKGSDLYFNSLASTELHRVPLRELNFHSTKEPKYVTYKGDVDLRKVPLIIQGNHVYFCGLENNALMEWDLRLSFSKKNLKKIVQDNEHLQFVSGMKSAESPHVPYKGVYGLSNKYQKTAAGTRDMNEYNFHVFVHQLS